MIVHLFSSIFNLEYLKKNIYLLPNLSPVGEGVVEGFNNITKQYPLDFCN